MADDLSKLTRKEFDKMSPEQKAAAQKLGNEQAIKQQTKQSPIDQPGKAPKIEQNNSEPSKLEQKAQKPGFWKALRKMSFGNYFKIAGTGLAAAALTGGGSLVWGAINATTTMGSYILAEYLSKRKTKEAMTSKSIADNSILGAAMTPIVYYTFKAVDMVQGINPFLKTGLGLVAAAPLFQGLFWPLKYVIEKYNPISFVKRAFDSSKEPIRTEIYKNSLKQNFVTGWSNTLKYMPIPMHIIWNYIPLKWMLPAAAGSRTLFKYLMNMAERKNKKQDNKQLTDQYQLPKYNPDTKTKDLYKTPQTNYSKKAA